MRTLVFTVLTAVCIEGCATSTGIVPLGPDTYVLSEMRAPVRGGGFEAQRVVLVEATGFRQRQGRDLVVLDLRPDGDPRTHYWPTVFDATFQCRVGGGGPPSAKQPAVAARP